MTATDRRTGTAPAAEQAARVIVPRRVLIVSADIGGGHHATGRALERAVRSNWPDAEVEWADALAAMKAGRAFRAVYRANVEWTPWLYDFFYGQIDRRPWFARASKAVTSTWAGLAMAPVLTRAAPDLVLSTYPLGSGGLAWLRRRGRLAAPTEAWISDFAPHPFWVYDELDLHVVMHPACLPLAHRAAPGARVVAARALPVVPGFGPGDRAAARRALGWPTDRFTVLVSCGVYGFGAMDEAVDVLLQEGGRAVQVVAACGRNEPMRRALAARPEAGDRLVVLGWTDRMAEVTRAADVVVSNAGGATALEALATGRPVLMFRPIAGHGRANAEVMATAGVAVLCPDGDALARALRRLLDDEHHRSSVTAAAAAARGTGAVIDDVERLLEAPATTTRPLSPTDEFFSLVDSPRVPQHVAALALLREGSPPVDAAAVRAALEATVPLRPWLTWRLERSAQRRPRWRTGLAGGPVPGTRLPVIDAAREEGAAAADFSQFVARPFLPDAPAWEIQVDRCRPDGRTALLVRAHHAFGDGLAVLDAFSGITTSRPTSGPAPSAVGDATEAGSRRPAQTRRRRRLRLLGLLVRGLYHLVRAGAAPPSPLRGPRSGSRRAEHALCTLPAAGVRAAAGAAGLGTSGLVVALVAEATYRFLAERGTPAPAGTVRAMVPRTLRGGSAVDGPGNRTVALRIDVPVAEMPVGQRLRQVRRRLEDALHHGQTVATAAVMRSAARLPLPLYRRLARWLYRSRWFDLIVSVIPGPRSARYIGTARVEEAYAVLPLAEGVGLAVGAMIWDRSLTVAVTYDPVLLPDGSRLAEWMLPAFHAICDDIGHGGIDSEEGGGQRA